MTLHRLTLGPRSPWRTPWQADTLLGSLCAVCARVHGPDVLRDRLIEPMLDGNPPFVLSDAFPGDLLPMPVWLRLVHWPGDVDRKLLKRARWMSPSAFNLARAGGVPPIADLLSDEAVFLHHTRQHNTLDRATDATLTAEQGGGLYNRPETLLLEPDHHLSLYFRILQPDTADLLLDLLHDLSLTGFGADVATGRGQFDIQQDPEPVPELDAPPDTSGGASQNIANAVISLSTFQPGPSDPTLGLWESFPKFGKIGPDLGLTDVRKNTLILFKPGACFHADTPAPQKGWLGRAVPMTQLLPSDSAQTLAQRGINLIHPAFGLTVPARLDLEFRANA